MASQEEAGIGLGCTTCGVRLLVQAREEAEVREELAGFFSRHAGCAVYVDASRTDVPLPRPGA